MDGAIHVESVASTRGWGGQFSTWCRGVHVQKGKGPCFNLTKSLLLGSQTLLAGQKFPVHLLQEIFNKSLGHKALLRRALPQSG